MPIPLFNIYGNTYQNQGNAPQFQSQQQMYQQNGNARNNILTQFMMVKNNPGAVLDIMLRNGKINQQQYNDLQQYRDDPLMMVRYLANNGKSAELNYAEQIGNQMNINNNKR